YVVFITLWSLLTHKFLGAYRLGWRLSSPVRLFDLAGGTVIHISAGVAGLVAAFFLGARQGIPAHRHAPQQPGDEMMGAGLLQRVSWFGFNAGSQVSSGLAGPGDFDDDADRRRRRLLRWAGVLIEAVVHRKSRPSAWSRASSPAWSRSRARRRRRAAPPAPSPWA
ncbi:MAG: ammonium transporter, partial [Proteobacteria bacterium]|nr:ammonium transporter [Pseudomonadota bacterium]